MEIQLPPLHPKQLEVARTPARFRVLVCGRRWGKTRLGVVEALVVALGRRGRVWWVAPTYAQASIGWRLARPMVADIPGVAVREVDRVIRFLGGGEFWFKSADRPDSLRGEGLDLLVIDEADFIGAEVWEQALRPTLSDRKGRALLISSPNVEGGWFHRLFQRGQGADAAWASWAFPSWTNPFLDPVEIDAARVDLPSIIFRREYGAEFVSASGARLQRGWIRTQPPPPRESLDVVMGVDLAISTREHADWSAAAVLGRASDGTLYVLDVARVRASFHQVLGFIGAMAERWRPRVVGVEAVQFQAAAVQELLRTTTLPVRPVHPGQRDKLTRFQPLEARYEQGLVRHAPGLHDDFERELLGFPVGEHDDQVDALSCAWDAMGQGSASFAAAVAALGDVPRRDARRAPDPWDDPDEDDD